jgi:GNAT superfamily N-acetyltransferase
MASDVTISDWTEAETAAFAKTEWPPHDSHLGIRWEMQSIVLVARSGERTLGYALGHHVGEVAELKQLLVRKDEIHRGVGSALLREFESRCRTAGCRKVRLETAAYQARPFYERHGFEVTATLERDRFGYDG